MPVEFTKNSGVNEDCLAPNNQSVGENFYSNLARQVVYMIVCDQSKLTEEQLNKCEGCVLYNHPEYKFFTKNKSGRYTFFE